MYFRVFLKVKVQMDIFLRLLKYILSNGEVIKYHIFISVVVLDIAV